MKNGGKFMEIKTGLRSSTDRSWVVLVRRSFKTREAFRCSCVYFATQCNVHYDNRQAGHLLSALRLERCTAAIIFPHNKTAQKSLNSVTVHYMQQRGRNYNNIKKMKKIKKIPFLFSFFFQSMFVIVNTYFVRTKIAMGMYFLVSEFPDGTDMTSFTLQYPGLTTETTTRELACLHQTH